MSEDLTPLVAVGGNSRAARSARAKLQWRDRFGRWIEMGRGVKFKIRLPNGSTPSVQGTFVGAKDPETGQVYVKGDPNGLKDGFYDVKSGNAQEILASVDSEYLQSRGIELGKDVGGNAVGSRFDKDIPNIDQMQYSAVPEGWNVTKQDENGNPVSFATTDGDYGYDLSATGYPMVWKKDDPTWKKVDGWPEAIEEINKSDEGAEWHTGLSSKPNAEETEDKASLQRRLDRLHDQYGKTTNPAALARMDDQIAELNERLANVEAADPVDPADPNANAPEGGVDTETHGVAKEGFIIPTGKQTSDLTPEGIAALIESEKDYILETAGKRLVLDTDKSVAEIYTSADTLDNAKAQAGGIGAPEFIDLATGETITNDKNVKAPENEDGSSNPEESGGDDAGADQAVGDTDQPAYTDAGAEPDAAGGGSGDGPDEPTDSDSGDDSDSEPAGDSAESDKPAAKRLTLPQKKQVANYAATDNTYGYGGDTVDREARRLAQIWKSRKYDASGLSQDSRDKLVDHLLKWGDQHEKSAKRFLPESDSYKERMNYADLSRRAADEVQQGLGPVTRTKKASAKAEPEAQAPETEEVSEPEAPEAEAEAPAEEEIPEDTGSGFTKGDKVLIDQSAKGKDPRPATVIGDNPMYPGYVNVSYDKSSRGEPDMVRVKTEKLSLAETETPDTSALEDRVRELEARIKGEQAAPVEPATPARPDFGDNQYADGAYSWASRDNRIPDAAEREEFARWVGDAGETNNPWQGRGGMRYNEAHDRWVQDKESRDYYKKQDAKKSAVAGKKVTPPARVAEIEAEGLTTPDMYELDSTPENAQKYHDAISKLKENNPYSASVEVYDAEKYEGMRLFMTEDGTAGIALDGENMVSGFIQGDSPHKGAMRSMLATVISQGGRTGDAFDTILPEIYAKEGYVPVARMPFNEEFAPEGWDYDTYKKYNNGRPDVVFLQYQPERIDSNYIPGEGVEVDDFEDGQAIARGETPAASTSTDIAESMTPAGEMDDEALRAEINGLNEALGDEDGSSEDEARLDELQKEWDTRSENLAGEDGGFPDVNDMTLEEVMAELTTRSGLEWGRGGRPKNEEDRLTELADALVRKMNEPKDEQTTSAPSEVQRRRGDGPYPGQAGSDEELPELIRAPDQEAYQARLQRSRDNFIGLAGTDKPMDLSEEGEPRNSSAVLEMGPSDKYDNPTDPGLAGNEFPSATAGDVDDEDILEAAEPEKAANLPSGITPTKTESGPSVSNHPEFTYKDSDEDYADEKFMPTTEQRDVVQSVLSKFDTVVQALAGSGKTTTLVLIAKQLKKKFPDRKGVYVVFNKKNQIEGERRMPDNFEVLTMDALAYRSLPKNITSKLNNREAMRRPKDIARKFDIDPVRIRVDGETRTIDSDDVARDILKAIDNWSVSADDEIGPKHFEGLRTPFSSDAKRIAEDMWADLKSPTGDLKIDFNHFTKMWALGKPDFRKAVGLKRPADILFVDEAQDLNPVFSKVIRDQEIQTVVVGDSRQSIYGFRGAEDEMDNMNAEATLPLTQSWRFGPQVAGYGNRFLSLLKSPLKIVGGGPDGEVLPAGSMEDPDAILTRSNFGALKAILGELGKGRVVGTDKNFKNDMTSFVNSVRALKSGNGMVTHEDLAQYQSWGEIEKDILEGKADYRVEMLSNIVDTMGIDEIERAVASIIVPGEDNSVELSPVTYKPGSDGHLLTATVRVTTKTGKSFPATPSLDYEIKEGGDGELEMIVTATAGEKNKWATLNMKDNLKGAGFRIRKLPDGTWQTYMSGDEDKLRDGVARLSGNTQVDVVVSTAHKSKGLEWGKVKIGDDFRGPEMDEETGEIKFPEAEEIRLAYVAVTRAQGQLDPGSLAWVTEHTDDDDERPDVPSRGIPGQEDYDSDPAPEATPEYEVVSDPTPESVDPEVADEPLPEGPINFEDDLSSLSDDEIDAEIEEINDRQDAGRITSGGELDRRDDLRDERDRRAVERATTSNEPTPEPTPVISEPEATPEGTTEPAPAPEPDVTSEPTVKKVDDLIFGDKIDNEGSSLTVTGTSKVSDDDGDYVLVDGLDENDQEVSVAIPSGERVETSRDTYTPPTPEERFPEADPQDFEELSRDELEVANEPEPEDEGDGLPDTIEELEDLAGAMERELAGARPARKRVLQKEIDKIYDKIDSLEVSPEAESGPEEVAEAPEVDDVADEVVDTTPVENTAAGEVFADRVSAGKDLTPEKSAEISDRIRTATTKAEIDDVLDELNDLPNRPDTPTTPRPSIAPERPSVSRAREDDPTHVVESNEFLNEVKEMFPNYTTLDNGDMVLTTRDIGNHQYDVILRRTNAEEFVVYVKNTNKTTGNSRAVRMKNDGVLTGSQSPRALHKQINRALAVQSKDVNSWFNKQRKSVERLAPGQHLSNGTFGGYIEGTDFPETKSELYNKVVADIARLVDDPDVERSVLRQLATDKGFNSDLAERVSQSVQRRKAADAAGLGGQGAPKHVSYDNDVVEPGQFVDWTDTDKTVEVRDANGKTVYGPDGKALNQPNPNYGRVYRGEVRRLIPRAATRTTNAEGTYDYSDYVSVIFPEKNKEGGFKDALQRQQSARWLKVVEPNAPMSDPFFPVWRSDEEEALNNRAKIPADFDVPTTGTETTPRDAGPARVKEWQPVEPSIGADGIWFYHPEYNDVRVPDNDIDLAASLAESETITGTRADIQPGDIIAVPEGDRMRSEVVLDVSQTPDGTLARVIRTTGKHGENLEEKDRLFKGDSTIVFFRPQPGDFVNPNVQPDAAADHLRGVAAQKSIGDNLKKSLNETLDKPGVSLKELANVREALDNLKPRRNSKSVEPLKNVLAGVHEDGLNDPAIGDNTDVSDIPKVLDTIDKDVAAPENLQALEPLSMADWDNVAGQAPHNLPGYTMMRDTRIGDLRRGDVLRLDNAAMYALDWNSNRHPSGLQITDVRQTSEGPEYKARVFNSGPAHRELDLPNGDSIKLSDGYSVTLSPEDLQGMVQGLYNFNNTPSIRNLFREPNDDATLDDYDRWTVYRPKENHPNANKGSAASRPTREVAVFNEEPTPEAKASARAHLVEIDKLLADYSPTAPVHIDLSDRSKGMTNLGAGITKGLKSGNDIFFKKSPAGHDLHEYLAGLAQNAIGIDDMHTAITKDEFGDPVVVMPAVLHSDGATNRARTRQIIDNFEKEPEAILLGLSDIITNQMDRNGGNYRYGSPDGPALPVDNEYADFSGGKFWNSEFGDEFARRVRSGNSPMTSAELLRIRNNLMAFRSEFVAIGGSSMFNNMMQNLSDLINGVNGYDW